MSVSNAFVHTHIVWKRHEMPQNRNYQGSPWQQSLFFRIPKILTVTAASPIDPVVSLTSATPIQGGTSHDLAKCNPTTNLRPQSMSVGSPPRRNHGNLPNFAELRTQSPSTSQAEQAQIPTPNPTDLWTLLPSDSMCMFLTAPACCDCHLDNFSSLASLPACLLSANAFTVNTWQLAFPS